MATPVWVTGDIIAITYPGAPGGNGAHTPEVRIAVETTAGLLTIIFQGRRTIDCVRVGDRIRARVVPLRRRGVLVAYNPEYTVL